MRHQTLEQIAQLAPLFRPGPIHDMGGNTEAYRRAQEYDLRALLGRSLVTVDQCAQPGVDVVDDLQTLSSFGDQSVDNIICSDVLEHVKNPFAAARTFHRVLRPGGLLYVATVFAYPVHGAEVCGEIQDFWRFTPAALRLLFSDFGQIHAVGFQAGDGDRRESPDPFKKGVFLCATR